VRNPTDLLTLVSAYSPATKAGEGRERRGGPETRKLGSGEAGNRQGWAGLEGRGGPGASGRGLLDRSQARGKAGDRAKGRATGPDGAKACAGVEARSPTGGSPTRGPYPLRRQQLRPLQVQPVFEHVDHRVGGDRMWEGRGELRILHGTNAAERSHGKEFSGNLRPTVDRAPGPGATFDQPSTNLRPTFDQAPGDRGQRSTNLRPGFIRICSTWPRRPPQEQPFKHTQLITNTDKSKNN